MSSTRRFSGQIAGVGSASGVRVVVGRWTDSPLGAFTDAMLAEPDGHRLLLAPTDEVAEFVSATYTFDEVLVGPFGSTVTITDWGQRWAVSGLGLELGLTVGRRTPLGWLLRSVPTRIATSAAWTGVTDPVARRVLRGVRTRGTAGKGRREYYGATDLHRVDQLTGHWLDEALGELAPVTPEPGFGFGSTPPQPSVTTLVTTIVQG